MIDISVVMVLLIQVLDVSLHAWGYIWLQWMTSLQQTEGSYVKKNNNKVHSYSTLFVRETWREGETERHRMRES